MDSEHLLIQCVSDDATIPTRASPGSVGLDLYSAETVNVKHGDKKCVRTDLKIAVPEGHYGRIAPRSGLAVRNFIDIGAGVIDQDYRGPLGVVVFNHSKDTDFLISKGDRIAQLIMERISVPNVIVMSKIPEYNQGHDSIITVQSNGNTRGSGGFGSTGI